MPREEKKIEKVRTTIDVNREVWAFVKSEATIRGEKTSKVVEGILKKEMEEKKKRER